MPGIDDFDIEAAAQALREENRKETERIGERLREARAEARRLAAELRRADPDVRTVLGFGSAFEPGRAFRMDSDIDLAIEGGDAYALQDVVDRSPFRVDLLDITNQHDEFATLIRRRGVALAGQDGGA